MKADEHWLNRGRLLFYSRIIFVIFFLIGLKLFLLSNDMVDQKGKPSASDFVTFWSASHLALTGHAQDAYNSELLLKVQEDAALQSHAVQKAIPWFYPPSFFLVVLPLALLPYTAAYWVFILSTMGSYLLVLRRIVRGSTAMWCLAAFSGLWLNFLDGQNGFLTATVAGAALLSIERRPILAGLFIGLLAIKPHLAILFPVALLAIGAWRTMITAAVTAISFMGIGTAVLGSAVLKGWLASLDYARHHIESGPNILTKMPSVFAFVRLLGMSVEWAYIVHFVVAVGAVIVVWRVWRQSRNRKLRGAALMTATFLVSPYVFYYDLAWLAFPIAWLALDGQQNGWLRGEREVLVFAWFMPVLMLLIAPTFGVQVGPLLLCGLLWITVRRSSVIDGYSDQFEPVL